MPLTGNQITAFFEDADQMAIPAATRAQLVAEGIDDVSDLLDFDEASLKLLSDNLRRPGGMIPDPANLGVNPVPMIPARPFVFGAKSQLRLKGAMHLIKYYNAVGRPLTAANIAWDPVIKTFMEHWKELVERKNADTPTVPKITKTLIVTKWTEAFMDFLHRVVGARAIPLSYVIRPDEVVPVACPALARDQPFSTEHGSVEEELIARASHGHALFRSDNKQVYHFLEEATRGTIYAPSLKPFQRPKNGRGAWLALVAQYAGEDKWRAELKKQDDLIHNRKWKGQSNFSLDRFISQHRNAFTSMTQCAEHVQFQLPNELTRVTYLLDAIQHNDAELQAAMALVRNDTGPGGKMNDFEATAAFLLPKDPVARNRSQAKRNFAEISAVETSGTVKSGIGSTGVPLRYHTKNEYDKLTPAQKKELHEHRNNRENAGNSRELPKSEKGKDKKQGGNKNSKLKKMISAAVAKEVNANATATNDAAEEEKALTSYILSVVQSAQGTNPTPSAPLPPAPSQPEPPTAPSTAVIQSILRRATRRESS